MTHDAENPQQDTRRDERFVFPGAVFGAPDAALDEAESQYVVFRSVAVADAESLCARLESNGIPCEIDHKATVADPSVDGTQVAIKVREADLAAAEEALADQHPQNDDEVGDDSEERLVASWICPQCHHRALELLPLSRRWRVLRFAWLGVLLLPFGVMLLMPSTPAPDIEDMIHRLPEWWPVVWLAIVALLASVAIFADRGRRCAECGWRSDRISE